MINIFNMASDGIGRFVLNTIVGKENTEKYVQWTNRNRTWLKNHLDI